MPPLWLLLIPYSGLLHRGLAEEGLEFPSLDGKDRVLDINERNFKKALKKYDMLCLLYHAPLPSDRELQQQFHVQEMVLEVSEAAQRGKGDRLLFVIYGIRLCHSIDIHNFFIRDERVIEFDGELSADTLVEFLLDVSIDDAVELISNPTEQRAFERMDEDMRLIGYFRGKDSECELLSSLLHRCALLQVAKQLTLRMNEVDFYEPFMDEPVTIPGKPNAEDEIVDFINQPTLRKLRAEDMFETWEDDMDGIHIVAFAEEEDPGVHTVGYVRWV
uniref:Calsequestrin n=1 Tax=Electrophorus electricus TaxID=8005 RepID=A0A4W4H344_ELEEL